MKRTPKPSELDNVLASIDKIKNDPDFVTITFKDREYKGKFKVHLHGEGLAKTPNYMVYGTFKDTGEVESGKTYFSDGKKYEGPILDL